MTECYNGEPWISWEVLGLEVKVGFHTINVVINTNVTVITIVQDERYKLRWKNSCDMSHSWNGIVRLLPGQIELMHTHTTPMIYYILQVSSKTSILFYIASISLLAKSKTLKCLHIYLKQLSYKFAGNTNCEP